MDNLEDFDFDDPYERRTLIVKALLESMDESKYGTNNWKKIGLGLGAAAALSGGGVLTGTELERQRQNNAAELENRDAIQFSETMNSAFQGEMQGVPGIELSYLSLPFETTAIQLLQLWFPKVDEEYINTLKTNDEWVQKVQERGLLNTFKNFVLQKEEETEQNNKLKILKELLPAPITIAPFILALILILSIGFFRNKTNYNLTEKPDDTSIEQTFKDFVTSLNETNISEQTTIEELKTIAESLPEGDIKLIASELMKGFDLVQTLSPEERLEVRPKLLNLINRAIDKLSN